MQPLFSIILTTYNRRHLLPRAIRSVIRQTYKHFELIIVDDCSTDDTQQLVTEFLDDKITYLQHTPNQGVSAARNTGIQKAQGTYICFLDDDDEYFPEFLEEVYHFLKKQPHDFIGFIRVGIANVFTAGNIANGKAMTTTQLWHLEQEKNLLFITKMAYGELVYHRLCFARAGVFNTELRFAEDLDLLLRLLATGIRYASIPKVLVNIHIHEQSSLSRSINATGVITAMEHFLFLHDQMLNQHVPLWLYYYTGLAGQYYRCGKKKLARKLVRRICKKCWHHTRIWEIFLKYEYKNLRLT